MIGILFILFNLSLYYTLSGFFLYMATETQPFVWGIPILFAVSAIYMFFRTKISKKIYNQNDKKIIKPIVILICALPAVILLFNPTIVQLIHFLPAWAIVATILLGGYVDIEHEAFKKHFAFTAKFYLLLILAAGGPEFIMGSIIAAISYFIIYMISGMTLLRILRQEGKLSKSREAITMLALLFIGIILTGLNMQQALASGLGLVTQGIAWLITAITLPIVYALYMLFMLLMRLFTPTDEDGEFIFGDMGQEIEHGESMYYADELAYQADWFPRVATPIIIILAIVLTILLIYYIKKRLAKPVKKTDGFIREEEYEIPKSQYKNTNKRKLFRPSDPRQSIRWYYKKYIKEGISRGAQKPSISDTTKIINRKYSELFPKQEASELRELYLTARYQEKTKITKPMSEKATKLWRKL